MSTQEDLALVAGRRAVNSLLQIVLILLFKAPLSLSFFTVYINMIES